MPHIFSDAITSIRTKEVIRPLRTTFSTSLGQKDNMQSVIVEVTLHDGSKGYGECATSFVLPHESMDAIKGIIREERGLLKGQRICDLESAISALRKKYQYYPMTISGLEIALFRARLSHYESDERLFFGGAKDTIETDITIPFITDEGTLKTWMGYAMKKGFTIFKVKVSGNIEDDERLLISVTSILGRLGKRYLLRLDGNQGFTARTYLTFTDLMEKKGYPVELFEQPLKKDDHKGLREIKERSPVPVILDETVFTTFDMEKAIEKKLGHGVNIKTAKSGISESLAILELANRYGFKLMAGCMTETMVGLSSGINLAMGTGSFDYIDLDSVHFLGHGKQYGTLDIDGPFYHGAQSQGPFLT